MSAPGESGRPPRFSVLMPTHNRPEVLGFAIASVLAQTEPDFELLVAADGCTDGTAALVRGIDDPRLRFFDLPKAPGFGYANRNIALRQARGRLIAFAAHDNLLLPDHLALMGALLEETGADWGYSRPLWVTTDGMLIPFGTNLTLEDERRDFRERGNSIPASCVVHTRDALERAGYWPEEEPDSGDWHLWHGILRGSAHPPAYLPQPTCLHFSANWRKSRYSQRPEVAAILAIADTATWWPEILRQSVLGGRLEQAAIWPVVQSGGLAWCRRLRAATEVVLTRLAWGAIQQIGDGDAPLPRHAAALADQHARLAAVVEELASSTARLAAEATRAAGAEAQVAAIGAQLTGAEARAAAAEARAATAEARAAAVEAALAWIRASNSWRITAPLRAMVSALKP